MLNSSLNNTTPSCVQANRGIWDAYAGDWSTEAPFVKQMLGDTQQKSCEVLGEEWSDTASFN